MSEKLWEPARMAGLVSPGGAIEKNLDPAFRAELAAIDHIPSRVVTALTDPKPLDINMPVFNAILAAQYYEVIAAIHPPENLRIYEPCVGASPPVIFAAETYSGGAASYFTINLNKKLCAQLRQKIAHLKMKTQIVEENALGALKHLEPKSFDLACFHHAVNDILQTAVSEPRGMDTTQIDWFPNERQMIEWLAEDARAGRLETRGKPELMQIVGDAVRLVKPGGHMIFDHFNWCRFIGVDWFPWDLFYNFIPMTREWIAASSLPVREIRLDGVDPQWWMVLEVL